MQAASTKPQSSLKQPILILNMATQEPAMYSNSTSTVLTLNMVTKPVPRV